VDKNDPGFAHPTKPIGAFFSDSQRDELQKANPDWCFVEDAGREMPFLHIAGHGGNIHPIERLLLRFAKVNTHFFDASGDHK
ncbi:hypothetical protein QU845_25215, partial [Escherichia coli]|nr:hypothetical protein [Escherichia coli]